MTTEILLIVTMIACACGFIFFTWSMIGSNKLKSVNTIPSIIEYKTLRSGNSWALDDMVTKDLNNGWVCVGGVSNMTIKLDGNQYDYKHKEVWSQAMQKEVKI